MKLSNPEYLAKVATLGEEEQERLLSRMSGKLPRRLEKDKLSRDEAIAIQMELEDEQLQEWREKMHAIKAKSEPEAKAKPAKEKAAKAESATTKPAKPAKAKKTAEQSE